MKTAIQKLMDELNKELHVAIHIGNQDKIKTIKHSINITSGYLEMEKDRMIEFASYYTVFTKEELEIGFNHKFKQEEKRKI